VSNKPLLIIAVAFPVLAGLASPIRADTPLTTTLVSSGLSRPVDLTAPPGDENRLFIVEQSGTIRIIKNGTLLATPFLDIDALVRDTSGTDERGLLGLAFHPNYATNGYFFVYYIDTSTGIGDSKLVRYTVSGDPATSDTADPNSAHQILTLDQPYANHNGGQLRFGPKDGYLYVGLGDGGSADDPGNRAQNKSLWFGKLLRIDPDGDDFPADPNANYAVPPDNPGFAAPEIWALGLRNPWRYAFDAVTGDLYIGDVGQAAWEEIDFQPAASSGGENFGWRPYEGNECVLGPCNPAGLTFPVHTYAHSLGRCSITGGVVYRGSDIPDLCGTYFFADWCSDEIWSFRIAAGSVADFRDRTAELEPPGPPSIQNIATFGTDGRGEIYVCDRDDGEVFKIVPAGPLAPLGDLDDDGDVDLTDFALFAQCFAGSDNPPATGCPAGVNADLDCDADVDLTDFATFGQNFTGSQ
jgi:glucose/arabinose dehydrogenase